MFNSLIYALELETNLHAIFQIIENWLFRPFFLFNYRQRAGLGAVRGGEKKIDAKRRSFFSESSN